jgi:fused signal recognition particle receptor
MLEKLKNTFRAVIDKLSKTELSAKTLDTLLWDFKLRLLENDVAYSVTEEISTEIKEKLLGVEVTRLGDKEKLVEDVLKETLFRVLKAPTEIDVIELLRVKRRSPDPLIMVFVGVNGTGKTTTIAKIANLFLKKGFSVVLAGSDTYRSGSIEQLAAHAEHLNIQMIKHTYGSDAAAVAYDAINFARSHKLDAVLIDTAGRMQTNRNLIDEMKKIIRVTKADLVLLVVDALTGNDVLEQGRVFNEAVGIDGVVLTKLDADVKGGSAISITYAIQKPIIFMGTGQLYDDLTPFDPMFIMKNLFDHV